MLFQIILGDRQTGKSTEIIEQAIREGCFIACINSQSAKAMQQQAMIMGMNDWQARNCIITHQQLRDGDKFRGVPPERRRVIIDDADHLLYDLISQHVVIRAITMSVADRDIYWINDNIPDEEREKYEQRYPDLAPAPYPVTRPAIYQNSERRHRNNRR